MKEEAQKKDLLGENQEEERDASAFRVGRKEITENAIGLGIIVVIVFLAFKFFDINEIREVVARGGVFAPLLFIFAKASTIVFAPLSGSPLYPLAGALFGFGEGFALLVLGDALGGTISFYISRLWGRKVVERFLRGDTSVVAKALSLAGTPKGFLVARVCFIALPEIASYAAGLTRLSFVPFFFIFTGIGLVPTAVLAYFGSLLSVLESGTGIFIILIVGTVAVFAGFALFNWLVKRN